MTIGTTAAKAVERALVDHGQLALYRRINESFDEGEGKWVEDSPPTDYVVHLVAEDHSDFVVALNQVLAGQQKVLVAARELPIKPRRGSETERADLIYFGDWATASEVDPETAESIGRVAAIDRTMRHSSTQIAWGLKVESGV